MRLSINRLGGNRFKEIFIEDGVVFGDGKTEGDWRIIRSGNNLNSERLESLIWEKKSASTA